MSSRQFQSLLADVVLVVHFGFVAFVLGGLLLIWLGRILRWSWVRNFWFRAAHVLAIGVVVAEALCGMVCPLTTWENQLRLAAGQGSYAGSFVQHWLHRVMFFEASPATFTVIYVIFFLAVLASFWFVPTRWPRAARAARARV